MTKNRKREESEPVERERERKESSPHFGLAVSVIYYEWLEEDGERRHHHHFIVVDWDMERRKRVNQWRERESERKRAHLTLAWQSL